MNVSPLPTGTVTFLFTDIESSTRLWQQHPEAMKGALVRHHALLQQAIESNGGYVFQIVGDAFCAAFHTASGGVAAALAAQRALTAEPWDEAGPIRVRMALHTGTADARAGEHKSGEYVSGLTLSHAARLLAVAYGGQILVSTATQELVHDDLPLQVELRDLGRHRLRDLAGAEHVFQVVAPDLPDAFPTLKSFGAIANNLPRQLTTFIGREREIAEAKRLLAEAHLLTATGPGGSGKTRLALKIAAAVLDEYPDGVWLLEFAPLADPAIVPQVLATTLGVREEAGRPLPATLIDHLRAKRVLLLFDNCEHLIDACAQLAEALLRACPDVKILASSREPLGLAGEVVFRVPPLSLPDPRRLPAFERFTDYEAIRLFVDRAAAVKRDFTLTDANAAAVAQTCQRLDGIPLAIELAAARVRTLSVHEITTHLDERFRLVAGGSRTALPRHQTLRGLIDWSYGLLSEAERALLRRLSVFVGGWTLGAAEAVCADDGVDRYDVVDLLGRLMDKSLILMDDQGSNTRYRQLETIRQYGLEKLAETAEGELVHDRHRDFYLGFAEDAEQRLQGAEQADWLTRYEADHDNLRAALRRSLDHREVDKALRLAGGLWVFWDIHGYVSEGREWLDETLAKASELSVSVLTPASTRARAKTLDGAARMTVRQSNFLKSCELLTQSLALWRKLDDRTGIAEALNNLATNHISMGDLTRAQPFVEEGLALFRELADKRGVAHALNNLADIAKAEGNEARAKDLIEESVPLFRDIQDKRGLAHALNNLGGMLALHGEYGGAETSYRESLQLAEELDDKHAIATALRSLGDVAHHQGKGAEARNFYEQSIAGFRKLNDRACLARSLIGFALASHDRGDHDCARSLGDEAVTLLRETGAKGDLALRLNQLGKAALSHGDAERAGHLFAESLVLRQELGDVSGVVTNLEDLAKVADARRQPKRMTRLLGAADALRGVQGVLPRTLEIAWWEGARAMTIEQVVAYAIGATEN